MNIRISMLSLQSDSSLILKAQVVKSPKLIGMNWFILSSGPDQHLPQRLGYKWEVSIMICIFLCAAWLSQSIFYRYHFRQCCSIVGLGRFHLNPAHQEEGSGSFVDALELPEKIGMGPGSSSLILHFSLEIKSFTAFSLGKSWKPHLSCSMI